MQNRVEKAHWKVGIRQRFIDHLPLATHNQLTYLPTIPLFRPLDFMREKVT